MLTEERTMTFIDKYRNKREDAFTLIEILIVIAIIGIIAAIAIPVFFNQRKAANDAAAESDIKTLAATVADLPPNSKNFTRTGINKINYYDNGSGKTQDIKISDGVQWTITGSPLKYCLTAYHTNGSKYTGSSPLTYDSTAGGLGRTGSACSPDYPTDGTGNMISQGNLLADAGLTTYNITTNTTWNKDIFSYYSLPFRTVAVATPVGNKAIEATTNNATVPQGIIMKQAANSPDSQPIQKSGEQWTVSMYVKAPAGDPVMIGARITDIYGSGYHRETVKTYTGTGTWQRIDATIVTQANDVGYYMGVQVRQGSAGPVGKVFQYAGPQVEMGTLATEFDPN